MSSRQQRYYNEAFIGEYYPYIYKAILERLQIYFCNLLYPDEPFQDAKKRFILADFVGGGNETAIRQSIENYQNSNGVFPFTAYNIDDDEPVDYKALIHMTGNYYDPDLDCYLSAVPAYLNINMMTVYTTEYDYYIGTAKMMYDLACLTRLDVPIMINGKETFFEIDIDMDVTKGDLAFAYQDHKDKGSLFNISHNCKVKFHYFLLTGKTFNSADGKQRPIPLYPVDNMILSLKRMEDKSLIDTLTVSVIPNVTSSTPASNAVNVSTNSSVFINFNTPMNESSVISSMDIVPNIEGKRIWNNEGTILEIRPYDTLDANTEYNINIYKTAQNYITHPLENDFELKFKTGA